MQRSASTRARPLRTRMAFVGQAFVQATQPMHFSETMVWPWVAMVSLESDHREGLGARGDERFRA